MAFSAVAIRRAEVRDASALAKLWLELGRHLVGLNPHAFKEPEAAGLEERFVDILSKPDGEDRAMFVAEVDGDVAGTIYVRLIPPMEAASHQVLQDLGLIRAEIDALTVAERFRRRGIGRLLMNAAEQWGREKGARLFFLDTYVASPLSVPFYERLGYAHRSVRFVKPPAYGVSGNRPLKRARDASALQPRSVMPSFLPGLELGGALYRELVRPILDEEFPGLSHSAALLGTGSEILGYDSERSTDHHWGPRLQLFVSPNDFARHSAIQAVLARRLPHRFRGFPTDFGPPDPHGVRLPEDAKTGPVAHRVEVHDVGRFLTECLGFDPRGDISLRDWLTTSAHLLLSITAGAVYHDGLDELEAVRARLVWYPHDVWLYLLACQWKRIAQEEPFVGRCGEVGDELGSRIVAARLVRDVMRLSFLLERQYAPHSKWLGTAFAGLRCAAALGSPLRQALEADDWPAREQALGRAYEIAGALHNALGITEPVDPSLRPFHSRPFMVLGADRFVEATRKAIHDEELAASPDVGSVDQFADSTDVLSYVRRARRLGAIYDEA